MIAQYKVCVLKHAKVFLLEDSEVRIAWFKRRFPDLHLATTAVEAQVLIDKNSYDFLFLDHDLGLLDYAGKTGSEGSGQLVAKYLSEKGYTGEWTVIHSWNPGGAAAMRAILKEAVAIPFGRFEIEFHE